jgi:hypothetical protein
VPVVPPEAPPVPVALVLPPELVVPPFPWAPPEPGADPDEEHAAPKNVNATTIVQRQLLCFMGSSQVLLSSIRLNEGEGQNQ